MNENPYLPPTTAMELDGTTPLWRTLARIAIFLYGCAYSSLIIYGHTSDSHNWDFLAVVKLLTIVIVDAMSCYGIFALAFRALRHASLYSIWRVFVWLLPAITIADTVYELITDAADAEEIHMNLTFIMPIVIAICTPVVIFNCLLVSRLKSLWQSNQIAGKS